MNGTGSPEPTESRARQSAAYPATRGSSPSERHRPFGAARLVSIRVAALLVIAAVTMIRIEIKHVEQVAERRCIDRHVRVVVPLDRVRQVVSAAVSYWRQPPVAVDELRHRFLGR